MADNLTPAQRKRCMSSVRTKDTDLEVCLRSELHRRGLRFRKHATDLPGKPDIVFVGARVAVFIDGDFWHGWRFPAWRHKVSDFWKAKIQKNRDRDQRNVAKLRRAGWHVIRLWQHQIEQDSKACVSRIVTAVESRLRRGAWKHAGSSGGRC